MPDATHASRTSTSPYGVDLAPRPAVDLIAASSLEMSNLKAKVLFQVTLDNLSFVFQYLLT